MCGGAPPTPTPPPPPEALPPVPKPVDEVTSQSRAKNKQNAALAAGSARKRNTTPLGLTDDTLNSTKKTVLGI